MVVLMKIFSTALSTGKKIFKKTVYTSMYNAFIIFTYVCA